MAITSAIPRQSRSKVESRSGYPICTATESPFVFDLRDKFGSATILSLFRRGNVLVEAVQCLIARHPYKPCQCLNLI